MIREPFAPGEWYHCYNRGIDKRKVFNTARDYDRFIESLYLCNTTDSVHRSQFKGLSKEKILSLPRDAQLVSIGAYCLMPNHFHILLKEKSENGITKFMHKLGGAYTMYFNIKNERNGNLFVKPFKSRRITDDRYLRHIVQYIHLNPAELFDSGWKEGKVKHLSILEKKLKQYMPSSLNDYTQKRIERSILDSKELKFLAEGLPNLKSVLQEAQAYFKELNPSK